MIKKWNQFNEEVEYNDGHISNIDDIKSIFDYRIHIPVLLEDILSGTGIIVVTKSGKVFEKSKSDEWKEYNSVEDFESKIGASLDNEYSGNKSMELFNLMMNIDDFMIDDIDAIYFEDQPTNLLKKLLKI